MNQLPLENLPEHLRERARFHSGPHGRVRGDFVLYWMCSAIRVDENPALEVARHLSQQLQLPLLVYQGLSERYAYASDRHHTFILQGASDVAAHLEEQGIRYALHLERPGDRGPHLRSLAERAAVVVTEDFPVQPQRGFIAALSGSVETPLLLVNTSCVVPPSLIGKSFERAYAYRKHTAQLYADRVSRDWPALVEETIAFDLSQLPFRPIDFDAAAIPDLVAECEIDHSVGPVLDTVGGSKAGYERWVQFQDKNIRRYAKDRNNPLLNAASRMSAYLHYGMVSPFRMAREANALGCAGADKYLDELLIWRELAYNFCHFRPDHGRWSALPPWAQQTLQAHQADARTETYSWEQLALAQTNDVLWNAAQKSLLVHGELHNNVRMTWGKAVLDWTQDPKQALRTLIDLNHRYALDGRDPASYGGILWCFGQFDRPFEPEKPVLGSVRPRPTQQHAKRLNVEEYSRIASRSCCPQLPHIAIVGAGLSGCVAGSILQSHGIPVTVFEKSRGLGGRMATRRTTDGDFDHGAQYFTARDPRFRRWIASWTEQGVVSEWHGQVVAYDSPGQARPVDSIPRYVATPSMNSLAKHIGRALPIEIETRVAEIISHEQKYLLKSHQGEELGLFDRVLVTTPAPQATELLSNFPEFIGQFQQVSLAPCWATMVRLASDLAVDWVGAFVNSGPLRWVSRESRKPTRTRDSERLVLHASSEWSKDHLEDKPEYVADELLAALWQITGLPPCRMEYLAAHRWRYSIPENPSVLRCFANADATLLACGDWAGGPRVEGAFLSGNAAAGRILGTLPYAVHQEPQLRLF